MAIQTRDEPDVLEDLIALVEVYYALPAEALRIILQARGVDCLVDLERLDWPPLAALAVHTHAPQWQDMCWLHRWHEPSVPYSDGPVMVDAGIG